MRLMNYSLLFMGFLGSLFPSHASLELIESGKLHVATSGKYPPYSFLNEAGNLDGLEIKLMEEVCRRLGLEYIPMLVAWESLIPGLLTGKYDISTLAMDITPEREKQATFIQPWIESKGVLVVRDDNLHQELKDFLSMPIGVLLASTWEEQLKNLGATDIKTYKTSVEALEDLKVGRIQAVATDYIFSSYAIKKNHFPLKILENINAFRVDKKGWLVKKENIKLVDAVNKVLSDIIEDGTYAKICLNIIDTVPLSSKTGSH